MSKPNEPLIMELSEHFAELRFRLLICVLVFAVATFGAFYLFPEIWPFVKRPLLNSSLVTLVNLSPAEGITVNILVACMAAALATSPLFLFHIYAFCAPAISKCNRGTVFVAFVSATVLFFAGAAFAYFFAIPFLFTFLASYSDSAAQLWSQTAYVSFLFRFVILFAILFQMPVAAAFLGRTGLLSQNFLAKHFRSVIFLIALVSALFTPPDLLSLFWMAIPMIILYVISLVTYRAAWRKR